MTERTAIYQDSVAERSAWLGGGDLLRISSLQASAIPAHAVGCSVTDGAVAQRFRA
jgi:hypothetical protein